MFRPLPVFFAGTALALAALVAGVGNVGGGTQTALACHVAVVDPGAGSNLAGRTPRFNPHECNAAGRNDVEQAAIANSERGPDICAVYDNVLACGINVREGTSSAGACGNILFHDGTGGGAGCSVENPRAGNVAFLANRRAECQARTDLNRTLNPNGNPRRDANGNLSCAAPGTRPPATPGAGIFGVVGDAFGALLGVFGAAGQVRPAPLDTGLDTDGDGTPDSRDNDKDGDGTPNNADSTPCGSASSFENASGNCVSCAFGYERSGNACELRGVGDDDDGTETPPDDPGVQATTTARPATVNLSLGVDPFDAFELPTLVSSLSLSVGGDFDGAITATILNDAVRSQLESAYAEQWRGIFSLTTPATIYPQTITISGVVKTLTAAPAPADIAAFSVSLTAGFATLTTQLNSIIGISTLAAESTLGLGKAVDAVDAFGAWLETRLSLSAALATLENELTIAGGGGAWLENVANQYGDRWLSTGARGAGFYFVRAGGDMHSSDRATARASCIGDNRVCRLASPAGSPRFAACVSACLAFFDSATTPALGSVVVSVIEGATLSLVSRYALSLATLAAGGGEISGVAGNVERLLTLAGATGERNFNVALAGNFPAGGFGESAGSLFGSFAARVEDCPNYSVLCFVKLPAAANVQLHIRPWHFFGFRGELIPNLIRAIVLLLALIHCARIIALGN